nr:MAG TPA: hypothetical protein [Caudoviricetes sp.]
MSGGFLARTGIRKSCLRMGLWWSFGLMRLGLICRSLVVLVCCRVCAGWVRFRWSSSST